jgi:hypothetical protein
MFGFNSVRSGERRTEMVLDFCLGDTHVDHVGHQFKRPLNGPGIQERFVGDGFSRPQFLKAARQIGDFPLQARCVYMGQGQQLVYTRPHHQFFVQDDYRCSLCLRSPALA